MKIIKFVYLESFLFCSKFFNIFEWACFRHIIKKTYNYLKNTKRFFFYCGVRSIYTGVMLSIACQIKCIHCNRSWPYAFNMVYIRIIGNLLQYQTVALMAYAISFNLFNNRYCKWSKKVLFRLRKCTVWRCLTSPHMCYKHISPDLMVMPFLFAR